MLLKNWEWVLNLGQQSESSQPSERAKRVSLSSATSGSLGRVCLSEMDRVSYQWGMGGEEGIGGGGKEERETETNG
jgi:hypothetical protein